MDWLVHGPFHVGKQMVAPHILHGNSAYSSRRRSHGMLHVQQNCVVQKGPQERPFRLLFIHANIRDMKNLHRRVFCQCIKKGACRIIAIISATTTSITGFEQIEIFRQIQLL